MDLSTIALIGAGLVILFLLRGKGINVLPRPANGGTTPMLPDLAPADPFLNDMLKMILRKLLTSEPLLAGENRIAKEFKALLTSRFPFLARMIDALDGDDEPAKPAA